MLTRVGHIARSSSGVLARLASTGTGSAQVTQLPNGLRVVTDNTPREVASVSVAIGGGASASTYQTRGVAHAVARNAFLGTAKRSPLKFVRDLEDAGASVSVSASRDDILYNAKVASENLPVALQLVSEAIIAPRVRDIDIEDGHEALSSDTTAHEQDLIAQTVDLLHQTAFRHNSVGLPVVAPAGSHIGEKDILAFRERLFNASNMVVSATGVSHEAFVKAVAHCFTHVRKGAEFTYKAPAYVGGEAQVAAYGDKTAIGFAFPGASVAEPQRAFAFQVLATMLGNVAPPTKRYASIGFGSSGVWNQLAAKQAHLEEVYTFNAIYPNTGLFGSVVLTSNEHVSKAVDSILSVFSASKGLKISGEAVSRAKAALITRAHFAANCIQTQSDALARDVLATGSPVSAVEKLEAVSTKDVQQAFESLASRAATVVSIGDIGSMMNYPEVFTQLK